MKLEFTGLKSSDRAVELSKLNLFRGPVGSGKSTALDAFRFLALGYVPANGKAESSTARLMRESELIVRLSLGDRLLERSLTLDKGKYRGGAMDSTLPPKAKATEHAESIRALFGVSDTEAAENLDLRQLLAASGNERAKKVQALLDSSGLTNAEIMALVAPLAICRAAKHPEDRLPEDPPTLSKVADGLVFTLDKPLVAALESATTDVTAWLDQFGLVGTIERVNLAKGAAAAIEKDSRAARKAIEDRKIEIQKPAETAKAAKAKRDTARDNRARLQAEIDLAISTQTARTQAEAPIPALRSQVELAAAAKAEAFARLDERPAHEAAIAALVDPDEIPTPPYVSVDPTPEADALDAEAAAIVDGEKPTFIPASIDPGVSARAALLDQEADQLSANADTKRLPELFSTAAAVAEHGAARSALELAKKSPWHTVAGLADEVDQHLTDDARMVAMIRTDQIRALAKANGGDISAIEARLVAATEALAVAESKARASAESIAKMRAEIKSLRDAADVKRVEAKAIRDEAAKALAAENETARNAYAEALSLWMKACNDNAATRDGKRQVAKEIRAAAIAAATTTNDALRTEFAAKCDERRRTIVANENARAKYRKAIADITSAAQAAQTAHDKATADLAAAEARLAGIASVSCDLTTTQGAVEQLDKEIAELDKTLEACEQSETLLAEMSRLLTEIEKATARKDAYSALEWSLSRSRNEDVRRRSGGIVAEMTKFLRAAALRGKPYIRVDRGECEFGLRRGSQEIAVEALSGGESVLFCSALAAAIIVLRKPTIKVLLIEGAELGSGAPAQAVMRGAAAMDLDLVMIATNANVEPVAGFVLHEVAAPVEAVA